MMDALHMAMTPERSLRSRVGIGSSEHCLAGDLLMMAVTSLTDADQNSLSSGVIYRYIFFEYLVNENRQSLVLYIIITSHHMEKTEAGLKGLYIREIALK